MNVSLLPCSLEWARMSYVCACIAACRNESISESCSSHHPPALSVFWTIFRLTGCACFSCFFSPWGRAFVRILKMEEGGSHSGFEAQANEAVAVQSLKLSSFVRVLTSEVWLSIQSLLWPALCCWLGNRACIIICKCGMLWQSQINQNWVFREEDFCLH